MFKNNKTANAVRLALIASVTASAFSMPVAFAAEEETAEVERVSVTGSRIKRTDIEGTSPIVSIGETTIEITGATNVAAFINELPSAGVPGSSDTNSNFSTSATGFNSVNLRNLGSERTLILVNGRRHVGGLAGSPSVDVSMIPVEMVERVDVVTGGASAVYGSEAIAGVINFIMKKEFDGVEFNGRFGTSDAGGADENDFTITAGGSFDDDKGHAIIHIGVSDSRALYSRERDISAHDATNSTFGPKGNFFIPGNGFVTQDESTGLWNKDFVAAEDGFDRNSQRIIKVPSKRVQFNANLNYEVNEHFNFFSETSYSQLDSFSQSEPTITGDFISVGDSVANIRIPLDNPFIPTELLAAFNDGIASETAAAAIASAESIAAGGDAISYSAPTDLQMFRRFVELGPRSSDVNRKVFRSALGFEGAINDDFEYEVYYQFGSVTQAQTNGGVFNTLNFYNALRTESDGNGGYQCADQFSRDSGCVPINVFGRGSIDGAALDWVSVDNQLTSTMEQQTAGATVSGSLFELDAGDVGVAFGYEWRKESSKFNSDSLAQSGLTSGNTTPNTAGEYDVNEYFVEAIVPLVSDVPFADYLGLELAARYSDYSTIGGASSYKLSLDWAINDDLKIRGGVSTAVRAPNIGELFDPGSETFRSFVDPCALGGVGLAATDDIPGYTAQTAQVQQNCATIAGTATLDPNAININSAGGLAAGNPGLSEETSDTTTFGIVYAPSQIENLSFTLDYFEITIDDAITSFDAQTTVDQCVRQGSFPSNPFCELIQRNATTGLVERIDALDINVAELETSGVDFTADYMFNLGAGELKLGLVGTYLISDDFVPFTGGEVVDSKGEIGSPDLKMNFSAVYTIDDLLVSWSTRYIDGVNVENDSVETFGSLGTFVYNDLQVRYSFGQTSFGSYDVFAGVDNVFDKDAPFLGQGVPGDVTGTNTASDVYDAIGRNFYIGFKAKF